jgi:signal transduction histidine kinase
MLFCATMSMVALWASSHDASDATAELLEEVEAGQQIAVDAERLVAVSRGYLLSGDIRHARNVMFVRRELERVLDTLDDRLIPEVLAEIIAVRAAVEGYVSEVTAVSALRSEGASATEIERLFEERIGPSRQLLRTAVDGLTRSERSRVHDLADRTGKRVRIAGGVLVVGSAVGTLIGILLAIIVARRLSGEFERGRLAAQRAMEAARARKDLLEMVSHDLRSPLQAIMLGLDVIGAKHRDLPHLKTVEHAAERVHKLVEDLLDASRAETKGLQLDRRRWAPRVLLDMTHELFAARAEKAGVRLELEDGAEDAVTVDRERILQVLTNLVANALSFTPPNGTISLSATKIARFMRFSVRDSGPGIAAEDRARLFGAFEQGADDQASRRKRRGSIGLGLYIATNLVRAHGGRIGVDSVVGQGSTFWFEVPLSAISAIERSAGASDRRTAS